MAKYILVKKVKGKKYEYKLLTPIVRRLYQKERPPVNMWRVPPTGRFISVVWI